MMKHKHYCTVTCQHSHLSPIPPDPRLLSTITAVQKANKLMLLKLNSFALPFKNTLQMKLMLATSHLYKIQRIGLVKTMHQIPTRE